MTSFVALIKGAAGLLHRSRCGKGTAMSVYVISFSPTGGTAKVAGILAAGLSDEVLEVELASGTGRQPEAPLAADDLAVLAVPSFAGRVPALAAERVRAISGNGARAVLVCVYGNRAFEDTLTELEDIARGAGFTVIAAVAAVAEHSIVREIAAARPDADDELVLAEFAQKILAKIESGEVATPKIPGERPYKQAGVVPMVPKATDACVGCGLCVRECPAQAIEMDDPKSVDSDACISCMRCMFVCPKGARELSAAKLDAVRTMLEKACPDRKANELFI